MVVKILLPHNEVQIQHFGYKGFIGYNPNIEIVGSAQEADYVWYHTTGDGHNVTQDLMKISHLNKPVIAIITGDKPPEFVPFGYLFGTSCGFNVPYEYDKFIPDYLDGCWERRKRSHLITFRGHRSTWGNRHRMDVSGVKVTWIDWWKTPENRRHNLMTDYMNELQSSVFSFCPRGNGPSSMRLFESMLMGAIPIRLDDWTKPFGQELDFSPRFDLASTNTNDIVAYCRNMTVSDINDRRKAMRDFVEKHLVLDYRNGCDCTLGYTEWIRRFVG
jgi:hypothetical protein